jgi:uncharacterized OsmC-like protein
MAPPDFLLASLATCSGYYALQYLRTRGICPGGLQVQVTAEKELRPARLAALHIDITAPELNSEQEAALLRAVNACLIHNTLMHAPVINTTIRRPAGVLAARSEEGPAVTTGAAGATCGSCMTT